MVDHIADSAPVDGRVQARYSERCCVAPSPELAERWKAELAQLRSNRGVQFAQSFAVARAPRRMGFDDGYIIPAAEFELGAPLRAMAFAAADRTPLRGNVRVAVVLVDFSDHPMSQATSHFENLFFSTGVLPHGSVREFYTEVTHGLITLTGDVVGPYRMPKTLAYYANNNFGIGQGGGEPRAQQLAYDAVIAADRDIDFGPVNAF